jgi:hypothetical protein
MVPYVIRVDWVVRVPQVNTRLGPNLIRVFNFITRWICLGNGLRAKRVRVRYFGFRALGSGFMPRSSPVAHRTVRWHTGQSGKL